MSQLSFCTENINRSKMSLGVGSLSFSIMIILGFYANHLDERIDGLRQRLSSLKDLAVRSQEAAIFIQAHREDFSAFEACGFEHPLVPETLQASLHYPIEFGAISSLGGACKGAKLIVQEVSFSIPCLRDRDVFTLLDRLVSQGPGIFQVHDMTITRVSPLNEEALGKIATGKPQVLFDGRIAATWIHQ